jgi:hypothetical protein
MEEFIMKDKILCYRKPDNTTVRIKNGLVVSEHNKDCKIERIYYDDNRLKQLKRGDCTIDFEYGNNTTIEKWTLESDNSKLNIIHTHTFDENGVVLKSVCEYNNTEMETTEPNKLVKTVENYMHNGLSGTLYVYEYQNNSVHHYFNGCEIYTKTDDGLEIWRDYDFETKKLTCERSVLHLLDGTPTNETMTTISYDKYGRKSHVKCTKFGLSKETWYMYDQYGNLVKEMRMDYNGAIFTDTYELYDIIVPDTKDF